MNKEKVLITGASRGIGRAIADLLSRIGYEVIGTSRYPEKINDPLDGVTYIQLDMNDVESIEACIREVKSVDVLINNAGQSQIGPAEVYPLDRTEALFQTNLFGPIQLIQGFLPGMRERKHGFIINIGSMGGKFAVPFQSTYVATKFALGGYTWSLRNEVMACGVRVTIVEPNDIHTAITPDVYHLNIPEYDHNQTLVEQVRDRHMANAPGPEVVARKVARMLKRRCPRAFYTVGGVGPLMVFVRRILPERLVEKLVRANFKLK